MVKQLNPDADLPRCVFGVANTELGRIIEQEMREWLLPCYNLTEVWHDGSLFEQPALNYMQKFCKRTGKPCLYIHTKGAYNRQDFSELVRSMWKHEFTTMRDTYFSLVDRPYGVVSCPVTGNDKTTWYNGFVANAQAMAEIPEITVSNNRMKFERLFIRQSPQVIGVLRNDAHRSEGSIDRKFKGIWTYYM